MAKKKYPRDPNAPKKPTRPFLYFMMDVAKTVKEELDLTMGDGLNIRSEVSKECGRRWSIMTTEEKEKYHEKFKEDSKRYQEAVKDYKPSPEFVEKARLAKLHNTSVTNPERNISSVPHMVRSYFDYLASSWSKVAASLPHLEPDQVQEEVWRRWSEGEPGGSSMDMNQNLVKKPTKKRIRKKVVKDPANANEPKAPRQAFQIFLATMKEELEKQLPDMSYADMLKHVSAKWKVMTHEQKTPFLEFERSEKDKYEVLIKEKMNKNVASTAGAEKERYMGLQPNIDAENKSKAGEETKIDDMKVDEEQETADGTDSLKDDSDLKESKLEIDLSDTSDNEGDGQDMRSSATRLSSSSSDDDTSESEKDSDEDGDDDSVDMNDV